MEKARRSRKVEKRAKEEKKENFKVSMIRVGEATLQGKDFVSLVIRRTGTKDIEIAVTPETAREIARNLLDQAAVSMMTNALRVLIPN